MLIRGRNAVNKRLGMSVWPVRLRYREQSGGVAICGSAALGERNGLERAVLGITETDFRHCTYPSSQMRAWLSC